MGAIDITKPLELADGTPVRFSHHSPSGGIVVAWGKGGPSRIFDTDGRHIYGELPDLQNVQAAMSQEGAFVVPPAVRSSGLPQSITPPTSAPDFLRRGADLLDERGQSYDNGAERSMARIVKTFNALTGHELSEVQGWMFMQTLKNVRLLTGSGFHRDSAEDCIAYAALAAEAAASAA